MGSVFRVVIGDRIWQLEVLKKNFTKAVFLAIFWNFQNRSFSEHPLKNAPSDFVKSVKVLDSNLVSLIKRRHIDLFLANIQLFQNTHKKHISWGLFLLGSEILDYREQKKTETVFLEGFSKFKKFGQEFVFISVPVDYKVATSVKRKFIEISRRPIFETYHFTQYSFWQTCRKQKFCMLLS